MRVPGLSCDMLCDLLLLSKERPLLADGPFESRPGQARPQEHLQRCTPSFSERGIKVLAMLHKDIARNFSIPISLVSSAEVIKIGRLVVVTLKRDSKCVLWLPPHALALAFLALLYVIFQRKELTTQ